MKSYGMDDAKVIIRDFGEEWVEFKPDGVYLRNDQLQYDPSQVLHWKYACELDDSDSPNPLTAPSLPFPFTASELAAFMLDGIGAAIASNYGNWEDGPDQEMLDSMGVLAREPKRAITDAYSAFMVAQATVGSYPVELQKRADRLRKIYSYRIDKANTREGVFAHGIDRDEANARRASAVASNAQLKKLYQIATKEYQAASCSWRKAMVNELLKPTSEQAATRAPATGTATPAPAETKAQRQDRRLNACENAGLNFKDYKGRLPDGVGKVADTEGVKRQPFSVDVKAALKRRESANREGVIVRRA